MRLVSADTALIQQTVVTKQDMAQDLTSSKYTQVESSFVSEKREASLITQINRRLGFTLSGDYREIIDLPDPIYQYHRAVPGTVDAFQGKLRELFPELAKLSDRELDEITRKRDLSG